MKPFVSAITLGVNDVARAKQFYSEGLGWPILQDFGQFVSFGLNDGATALALYQWDALAADAGVPAKGDGFRGITFSYIVHSDDRVDAALATAVRAGGKIAKAAEHAQWGGYSGVFTDLDGYPWKVAAANASQVPFAE